jgi:hypothetical protein
MIRRLIHDLPLCLLSCVIVHAVVEFGERVFGEPAAAECSEPKKPEKPPEPVSCIESHFTKCTQQYFAAVAEDRAACAQVAQTVCAAKEKESLK